LSGNYSPLRSEAESGAARVSCSGRRVRVWATPGCSPRPRSSVVSPQLCSFSFKKHQRNPSTNRAQNGMPFKPDSRIQSLIVLRMASLRVRPMHSLSYRQSQLRASSCQQMPEFCHHTYQSPALRCRRVEDLLRSALVGWKPCASRRPGGESRETCHDFSDPADMRNLYKVKARGAAEAHSVSKGPAMPCRMYKETPSRFCRK
jgi:hypothetical protein